jgi:hypothetical protein
MMTLVEISQALKSPNARVMGAGTYANRRGVKGYKVEIRTPGHWIKLSLPRRESAVGLSEIAAALGSTEAQVMLDSDYERRSGSCGHYVTVFSNQQWYLISVSDVLEIEITDDSTESFTRNSAPQVEHQSPRDIREAPNFLQMVAEIVEWFCEDNRDGAGERLIELVTQDSLNLANDQTEEFFTQLIEQLDEIASELGRGPDELIKMIGEIDEYFPDGEEIAAEVQGDYQLRGILLRLLQRDALRPLGPRLHGLSFGAGVKELNRVFKEVRRYIVGFRGLARRVYTA